MKAGERLHEWASGVRLGTPSNGFRAHIEPRIKWKWCRIGASVVPWCPECGTVVAVGSGQRRHEENIHGSDELVVVTEPDGDEDQAEEETE